MITVERPNEYSSRATIFGWFVGVAWFEYTSPGPPACRGGRGLYVLVIIGLGFELVAAAIMKAVTGDRR